MLRSSQYVRKTPCIVPLPWDTRLEEKQYCEHIRLKGRIETSTIGELSDVHRFTDQVPAYCWKPVVGITSENRSSYRQRPTQVEIAQKKFEQEQEERRRARQDQSDAEWKAAAPSSLIRDPVLELLDAMPHAKDWSSVQTRKEWSRFGEADAMRRQIEAVEWLWRRSRMLAGYQGTKEQSLIDLAAWKATADART